MKEMMTLSIADCNIEAVSKYFDEYAEIIDKAFMTICVCAGKKPTIEFIHDFIIKECQLASYIMKDSEKDDNEGNTIVTFSKSNMDKECTGFIRLLETFARVMLFVDSMNECIRNHYGLDSNFVCLHGLTARDGKATLNISKELLNIMYLEKGL